MRHLKHTKHEDMNLEDLFNAPDVRFILPIYQRGYGWTIDLCRKLWENFYNHAFPQGNATAFNEDDAEYLLGMINSYYISETNIDEIIDGQQRLTTLLLLFRAFYDVLKDGSDIKQRLAKCIWDTDEDGNPDKSSMKLRPEIITMGNDSAFRNIMLTGQPDPTSKDTISENFRFFQTRIVELEKGIGGVALFATRILETVFVIRLRNDSREKAIDNFIAFNTTNLPFSQLDIFKAELCRATIPFDDEQAKLAFIEEWNNRVARCEKIFPSTKQKSSAEFVFLTNAFNRKTFNAIKLEDYYSADNYAAFKDPQTMRDIDALIDFFTDLKEQNTAHFSPRILRQAHIIFCMKNVSNLHLLSVHFIANCDDQKQLDEEKFYNFLKNSLQSI